MLPERTLSEPDRLAGELLQPSGVLALEKLGMGGCVEGIGEVPVVSLASCIGERVLLFDIRQPRPRRDPRGAVFIVGNLR